MQENSGTTDPQESGTTQGASPATNPDMDGRNKEWQDRARVNIEQTPERVHTNVERDFEPENLEDNAKNIKNENPPAY